MTEPIIKKAFKNARCDWEKGIMCFALAEWYIEGGHYCQVHAERVIQILNDNGAGIDINKIKWINKLKERRD